MQSTSHNNHNSEISITLKGISKKYNKEWIFKNLDFEFTHPDNYVILGANGAGKSTLLQLIAGNIQPSSGNITYDIHNVSINEEKIFSHLAIAAPYLELIEEFTLLETINFHSKFKPFIPGFTNNRIIDFLGLSKTKNKQLKNYSSGMKQRVRLALAFLSKTPLLLLDEPLSNLDKNGVAWYREMISNTEISKNRLIIICSNQHKNEYDFCSSSLEIEDYK